jgi:hypothetical protein
VSNELPAVPQPEPPPTIDDEIYQKLVEHENDVQGLLAYGLFSQSERDWIKRFYGREGRLPSEREMDREFYFSYDPGDIERLRTQAQNEMLRFALSILDDKTPEIEEMARRAAYDLQLAAIREQINKSGSWFRTILAGVISSLVFAVLTITFVAIYFMPGIRDIAQTLSK